MIPAITAISILVITGLVSVLNRVPLLRRGSGQALRSRLQRDLGQAFKVCPICAGVSVTWLWMLAGLYAGWLIAEGWRIAAAMAMGGSVVGIAYQIEKRLPPGRSPLLWKTFFIPAGFIAAYSLVSLWFVGFAVTSAFLVMFAWGFLREPQRRAAQGRHAVEELENKMKNCC